LENVRGFTESNVLRLWKQVMRRCGYRYKQYLLSPEASVGLPNCRKRYYFVAEHSSSRDSRFLAELGGIDVVGEPLGGDDCVTTILTANASATPAAPVTSGTSSAAKKARLSVEKQHQQGEGDSDEDDEEQQEEQMMVDDLVGGCILCSDGELLHTTLPTHIASQFPSAPLTIGEVLAQRSTANRISRALSVAQTEQLWLPERILTAPWAADFLSIVSPFDRISYCFTKGYGRIYDRSTGSCYYPTAIGAEADPQHKIDRTDLTAFRNQLRLFDPDEILLLSGFPADFAWPSHMSLQRRWGCIGNSVNVTVVRAVMRCLFE
jgi:site-specific DNA-cytosine methylase